MVRPVFAKNSDERGDDDVAGGHYCGALDEKRLASHLVHGVKTGDNADELADVDVKDAGQGQLHVVFEAHCLEDGGATCEWPVEFEDTYR